MIFHPPTQNDLQRLYYELSALGVRTLGDCCDWNYDKNSSPEKLLCLAAEMSRYDPRLFSSLVEYFYFNFTRHNPLVLRQHLLAMAEPQTLLVIFNFVARAHPDAEAKYMIDYLARDFKPIDDQIFFKGLYHPGSFLMWRAASESLEEFSSWGFMGRERPVIHRDGERQVLGHWSVAARLNMAKRLQERDGHLTLSTYLIAVEHSISRQQAGQDLKKSRCFKMRGSGRGAVWVKN